MEGYMNQRGQIEPVPLLMGIVGGVIGWILAGRMDVSFLYQIVTTLITMVSCYFLAYFIANN